MNLSRIFLFFFLIIISTSVFAQPSYTQKFLPVFTPPSPEASAFAKYGNYQVNLFTGVPEISVPLYEIKVGELTVPISLNYHASGIRVNEVASRVGLGWDLQAGGTINRKVVGRADELDGNYLSATSTSANRVRSTDINTFSEDGLLYLKNVNDGIYDVEPDIFSYNFPGHSGRFLFNQKNNFSAFLIPYAPVSVSYTRPTSSSLALGITDENGISYKFDSTEWSSSGGGISTVATSAWLMNDMISANKQDSIHFRYQARTGGGITDTYFSDYYIVNDNCTHEYNSDLGTPYTDIGTVSTWWKQLTQIDFRGGKVVFEAGSDNREDFSSQYQLQKRLNAIKIYAYDAVNNSYSLKKTIQFFHSYFIKGTDAYTKRLRLDSIQIKDAGGVVRDRYIFNYNTNIQLPENTSRMKDYWGYFNNIDNRRPDNFATSVPRMQIDYQVPNNPPTTIWIGGDHTNARDPDPSYMQAYILQKITFPTGGFTQFEYETNQYLDDQNNPKYAGGLRIKSIKSYNDNNAIPLIKTYKYGVSESGYGRNNFLFADYFFVSTQTVRNLPITFPCDYISTKRVRTFFANPTNDLESYDGAAVVYPCVTEYIGDGINNTGKTIYEFNDKPDNKTDLIGYGKPLFDSYHFIRGLPTRKADYKRNSNGTYTLISENRKRYQYFQNQFSTGGVGLFVYKASITQEGLSGNVFCGLNYATACTSPVSDCYSFIYNNYDLLTGDNKLISDSTFIYDQADTTKFAVLFKKYIYDDTDHLQVKRVETMNSKDQTLSTSYTYPYNYGSAPYTNMTSSHIYSKIVQEADSIGSSPLTLKKINYVSFSGSNYLPGIIQYQTRSNSIENRASFNSYDLRGNVLEMQKDNDVKQSLLWDQPGLHPIAEVTNASKNEIFFESFEEPGTWNSPAVLDAGRSHTGKYSARITNTTTGELVCHSTKWLNISLTAPTKYKYSGWIYSNGPYVEIFLFMKRAGETGYFSYVDLVSTTVTGKWVYVEKEYTVPADVTQLNIRVDNNQTGTIWFDDIRLHPSAATMTTYTYDPLVGVTSVSDINSRPVYYEYDAFSRLSLVRDQDGNIVKKICYNYAGQPEDCGSYYVSVAKSGNFTKNNCASGGSPSTVTYTVAAGTYTSRVSQADADQKAQDDVNANGQAYANANCTCTFYNVTRSGNFTRNNCAAGGTPGTVTYTVNAGTYSSLTDQASADQLAQNDVNANGQNYANTNATCTFYNVTKSGNFTRNNCAAGGTPGTVTYTVNAGTYSSTVNQATADQLAQNDVNANGQTYANNNATCTFYNVARSGNFTKNNCPAGQTGSVVTYTVAANTYSSTTSQAAADQLAQNAVNANGQSYANSNGVCTVAASGSNVTSTTFYAQFTNTSTSQVYYMTIPPGGTTSNTYLPPGTYNIYVYQYDSYFTSISAFGNFTYGYSLNVYGVSITAAGSVGIGN